MLALWVREAEQVIREMIGSVGSSTEYNVLLGLAILGFLFGLFNISEDMGSTIATPLNVMFSVAVISNAVVAVSRTPLSPPALVVASSAAFLSSRVPLLRQNDGGGRGPGARREVVVTVRPRSLSGMTQSQHEEDRRPS